MKISISFRKLVLALAMIFITSTMSAETLNPITDDILYGISKYHKATSDENTWEYYFDMPEANENGSHWTRIFDTEGSLIVEEEGFSGQRLYVKLRIPEHASHKSGEFHLWVKRNLHSGTHETPEIPTLELGHNFTHYGDFSWKNPESTLAVSLYNRETGNLLLQRVISHKYDEVDIYDFLEPGCQYMYIFRQSNKWGKYSQALSIPFDRVITKHICSTCNGTGVGSSIPGSNTPGACPCCKGHGEIEMHECVIVELEEF